MNYRIIADSSANFVTSDENHFSSVPLTIMTAEAEYRDDEHLDVQAFQEALAAYKGKSSTACPGAEDWFTAFHGADFVFGVALTSKLSGCYNSGRVAANIYTEEHPDRKVFILDSLSTGPEMELIIEKYDELVKSGLSFEEIVLKIQQYQQHTGLAFMLKTLQNFANNGRVSPILAKAVGLLDIRIVGKASEDGDLAPLNKVKGEKRSLAQLVTNMESEGYAGGKVRIRHTENLKGAAALRELILAKYPDADIKVRKNRGLCSYYAETGGLLVGFEN